MQCIESPAVSLLTGEKECTMQKDVVCGMSVEAEDAETSNYQGKTYYFCSTECKNMFDQSPAEYAKKDSAA